MAKGADRKKSAAGKGLRKPAQAGPARRSIGARRSPEARAAIISAARDLLEEKGYAGFSFEEVARRAGAGKPTIYRWWPNKAELFIEVYGADKDATIEVPDTGSLADDLAAYTVALWRFWRETPSGNTFNGLVAEAQSDPAALDALRTKFLPERLRGVHDILDAAVARGEIDAADVEILLELYIGFNWFHVLTGRIDEDPQKVAHMARTLAEGVKACRGSKGIGKGGGRGLGKRS